MSQPQSPLPPNATLHALITEIVNGNTNRRGLAIAQLAKRKEQEGREIAEAVWGAFGVVTILLQEVINVFPYISPPTLQLEASDRVCNALNLLQCVASHEETRPAFLSAHIPLFLYPFLNTTSKLRPFEYLRLTSLSVLGALVKPDSPETIAFLLSTELIPLCLRIMESGSELCKTVAIFILQKILLDEVGLQYICQTYERFYAVGSVLSIMVAELGTGGGGQQVRLLKHVIRCYLRLSDNSRAREALRQCLPNSLRDTTFSGALKDDSVSRRCLSQLLANLDA